MENMTIHTNDVAVILVNQLLAIFWVVLSCSILGIKLSRKSTTNGQDKNGQKILTDDPTDGDSSPKQRDQNANKQNGTNNNHKDISSYLYREHSADKAYSSDTDCHSGESSSNSKHAPIENYIIRITIHIKHQDGINDR